MSGIVDQTIQWAILELALEKSRRAFDLAPSRYFRRYGREADQLRELGEEGNIIWASPIRRQSEDMLPIEIPFSRGLVSYRYLWVPTADVENYSHIRTADGLKDFTILTGQNWGANHILEAEGFDLRKGYSQNLPEMLIAGRGEILLWPAFGVYNLYENYGAADMEMMPVPNVLVHLPQAFYFWVANEGSQELHDAVALGLKTAMTDGSLDALIRSFRRIGDAFADLSTNKFNIIEIENTDMSDELERTLDMYNMTVNDGG